MGKWPWRDSPQARLRRIVESYRLALLRAAPEVCQSIDEKMIEYGQRWVCSETIIESERLISGPEVAEEFGIEAFNVRDWARRHPDQIPVRGRDRRGRNLFRLGDILMYWAKMER